MAIGAHAYLSHRRDAIVLEMLQLSSQKTGDETAENRRYRALQLERYQLGRWPGVQVGAGVTAVGLLLLVVRRWWPRVAKDDDTGPSPITAVLGAATLLSAVYLSLLVILGLGHSGGVDPFSGLLILSTVVATLIMPFVMFAVRKHPVARYSLIGICFLVSATWGWLWVAAPSLLSWGINAFGLALPLVFALMLFRGRDRPVYESW